MRFVDSSVFVYAYLRPLKKLSPELVSIKTNARKIVERISGGESVATSLVHVSEIVNILESRMALEESLDIVSGLLDLTTLQIADPTKPLYDAAVQEARTVNIGVNDALASLLMNDLDIKEVYSFDTDFDKIDWIQRIVE